MALITIKMIENRTMSGRPSAPEARAIEAQQTMSASSHRPPLDPVSRKALKTSAVVGHQNRTDEQGAGS